MLFDLIVIGSGPAGLQAALQGAKAGRKVAIIEECPALGGSCVHFGTLPSKAFRESVYRWSLGSRGTLGQEFEHSTEVASRSKIELPDMKRLLRRYQRVVREEAEVVQDQLRRNQVTIFHGRARLVNETEVEVSSPDGRRRLGTSVIILALGARPVAPSHLTVDGEIVLDSNSILSLRALPRALVVLGGGIIGCEYASIFSMAGTKVYLVDRRHEILANVDREAVSHLVERLVAQGVEIILEAEATGMSRSPRPGGRRAATIQLSNDRKLRADAVLIALGRMGNTEDMGLEEVGIARDSRGLIQVDTNYRTTVPGVYAVGDVIGPPALASTSMEEGRIACCHAFGLSCEGMPRLFPYAIYTIPEISMLGATEEDLVARRADFVVGRARYRELARGQIVGDRWGLLKILVERSSGRLLGIHIVGDNAAELIHIGQAVMALDGDVKYFINAVFNYPTLAEAYKTAAFHAVNQMKGKQGT